MMDVVMTCVVETGAPSAVMASIAIAEDVSATKPMTGFSFVTPSPTVRMMRPPPMEVPRAMVHAHMILTHTGMPAAGFASPAVTRARVMMPMVFCASLLPWLYAMNAAERICILWNSQLAFMGCQLANSSNMSFMIT